MYCTRYNHWIQYFTVQGIENGLLTVFLFKLHHSSCCFQGRLQSLCLLLTDIPLHHLGNTLHKLLGLFIEERKRYVTLCPVEAGFKHCSCHWCACPDTAIHIQSIKTNELPYSGKYSWGPNFILSLSERKFNTRNVRYDGWCKMDRTKVKLNTQISWR